MATINIDIKDMVNNFILDILDIDIMDMVSNIILDMAAVDINFITVLVLLKLKLPVMSSLKFFLSCSAPYERFSFLFNLATTIFRLMKIFVWLMTKNKFTIDTFSGL